MIHIVKGTACNRKVLAGTPMPNPDLPGFVAN